MTSLIDYTKSIRIVPCLLQTRSRHGRLSLWRAGQWHVTWISTTIQWGDPMTHTLTTIDNRFILSQRETYPTFINFNSFFRPGSQFVTNLVRSWLSISNFRWIMLESDQTFRIHQFINTLIRAPVRLSWYRHTLFILANNNTILNTIWI